MKDLRSNIYFFFLLISELIFCSMIVWILIFVGAAGCIDSRNPFIQVLGIIFGICAWLMIGMALIEFPYQIKKRFFTKTSKPVSSISSEQGTNK